MASTVNLSTPLLTHKGHVDTIDLKAPKVRSFVKHGEPFKLHIKKGVLEDITFNNETMAHFISDMSGIDFILIEEMSATDYSAVRNAAVDLILGLAGDSPLPTSAA